jgi:exosortase A
MMTAAAIDNRQSDRRLALFAFVAAMLAVLVLYADTYASIVEVWRQTSAYSHCILILPISAFLIWQQREALSDCQFLPSLIGIGVLLLMSSVWFVSNAVGIQFLTQLAAVAVIPALVYALLGSEAFGAMRFALLYLFFAVPFGDFLIPYLMDFTAAFCVDALNMLGIPVLREGRFFVIPTGSYEVAKACSGLQYFVATFALTTLVSYMFFAGTAKRIAFVGVSLALAVVANGIRATSVVLILHFSDFDIAAGEDHEFIGLIVFTLLLIALFLLARRFQDREPHASAAAQYPRSRLAVPGTARLAAVTTLAVAVAAVGPISAMFGTSPESGSEHLAFADNAALPADLPGWNVVAPVDRLWLPVFGGYSTLVVAQYRSGAGGAVDVALVKYESRRQGAEVSSASNKVVDPGIWKIENVVRKSVELEEGMTLSFWEAGVSKADESRLIWYWFNVNGDVVSGAFQTKLAELRNFLWRERSTSSAVIVSSRVQLSVDDARRRLLDFLNSFQGRLTACLRNDASSEKCNSGIRVLKEG